MTFPSQPIQGCVCTRPWFAETTQIGGTSPVTGGRSLPGARGKKGKVRSQSRSASGATARTPARETSATFVDSSGECQKGIHVFAVYCWHSKGWTKRKEEPVRAMLGRVANTKSHWIPACDANMEARDFKFCDGLQEFSHTALGVRQEEAVTILQIMVFESVKLKAQRNMGPNHTSL